MSIRKRISDLEIEKKEEKETSYSSLCTEVKKSEEIVEIYQQLAEFAISEKKLLVARGGGKEVGGVNKLYIN